jgi:hypothetical protein
MPPTLSPYCDDLICLLAAGRDPSDRQSFITEAEAAIAAMPVATLGPGSAYKAVEGSGAPRSTPPTNRRPDIVVGEPRPTRA